MLVVDDDPRNSKLLEGYLVGEGYQVRTAADERTG
jgi:CheY-like chemotaxis protein